MTRLAVLLVVTPLVALSQPRDSASASPRVTIFAGASQGVPGFGRDARRWGPLIGVETESAPQRATHVTFGLAYGVLRNASRCCGPEETLTYDFHGILPSLGGAIDLGRAARRIRFSAGVGPVLSYIRRRGTPPAGVSESDAWWNMRLLVTSVGASLHWRVGSRTGASLGVRSYRQLSILGVDDPMLAVVGGISWP